MVNKVILVGRLADKPEARYTEKTIFTNFRLITTEKYTTKDNSEKESTDYHNVVLFGKSAEACAERLDKDSLVCVEGKLKTRSYTKKGETEKKWITEIHASSVQFLDGVKEKMSLDLPQTEDLPF